MYKKIIMLFNLIKLFHIKNFIITIIILILFLNVISNLFLH